MSKPKDDISVDYLREIFDYDPDRGLLIHKGRFNVKPGMIAGHLKTDGYVTVTIHRRKYYVHRIIWTMVTGTWPDCQIDHLNLDKADNRWANLRQATISQNKANIRAMTWKNYKGAYRASKNRWRSICGGIDLGYFLTEEAANAAYAEKAKLLYGEFARA